MAVVMRFWGATQPSQFSSIIAYITISAFSGRCACGSGWVRSARVHGAICMHSVAYVNAAGRWLVPCIRKINNRSLRFASHGMNKPNRKIQSFDSTNNIEIPCILYILFIHICKHAQYVHIPLAHFSKYKWQIEKNHSHSVFSGGVSATAIISPTVWGFLNIIYTIIFSPALGAPSNCLCVCAWHIEYIYTKTLALSAAMCIAYTQSMWKYNAHFQLDAKKKRKKKITKLYRFQIQNYEHVYFSFFFSKKVNSILIHICAVQSQTHWNDEKKLQVIIIILNSVT